MNKFIMTLGLCLGILVLAILPSYLSTHGGQSKVREFIHWASAGQVEVNGSHVSWFGPQQFTDVQWTKKSEKLTFESVNIDASFLGIVTEALRFHRSKGSHYIPQISSSWVAKSLSVESASKMLGADAQNQRKAVALLGQTVDIEGHTKQSDSSLNLELNTQGQAGTVKFNGKLQDGILTLNSPFESSIEASEQFMNEFIRPMIPLVNTFVHPLGKIEIKISPKGFKLPLHHSNMVEIEHAEMTVGKLELKGRNPITELLKLLQKGQKEKAEESDQVILWFTPLYFSIKNKVLELERTDILAMDRYHLAIWGSIDIENDHLKMSVGVSPKMLGASIASTLVGNNDMLALPITGTSRKATIDMQAFATLMGNTAIKHLLGKIDPKKKDIEGKPSKQIPRPTTTPFPWE